MENRIVISKNPTLIVQTQMQVSNIDFMWHRMEHTI